MNLVQYHPSSLTDRKFAQAKYTFSSPTKRRFLGTPNSWAYSCLYNIMYYGKSWMGGVPMKCTALLREWWRYQNGWIFGKFPRGEGSSWIQKFTLQILDLQTGLLNILFRKRNCNTIFQKWGKVKGRLELFLKFIRFGVVVSHQSSITWSSMCRSSWSTS